MFSRFCNTTSNKRRPVRNTRRRRLNLFCRVAAALCLLAPSAPAADQIAEARDIFARAEARVSLATLKSPYSLQLSFGLVNPDGTSTRGTYDQIWNGPQYWRRTIRTGDFVQTEVVSSDKRYVASPVPYDPERFQAVKTLLDDVATLHWKPSWQDASIKRSKDEVCVRFRDANGVQSTACFDPSSYQLRTITSGHKRYEYTNYQPFGDREFPRVMRLYEEKTMTIEARVERLVTTPPPDAAILNPPADAQVWDYCPDMVPPKAIRQPDPKFPGGVRGSGYTMLWVIVGKDGRVERGGLEESGGRAFDKAAADAVQQWLFRPALCNGMPVRAQISVEFNFVSQF